MESAAAAQPGPQDPRLEVDRRLASRRAHARHEAEVDRAFSWLRLAAAAAVLIVWWFTLGPRGIAAAWLLVPGLTFAILVLVHDGVVRRRRLAERAVAFYEASLARLEDRWAGTGEAGERFVSESHPFAADLDLFGRGSLFELVCTARTGGGQETLAAWLRDAAAPPRDSGRPGVALLRARQLAVAELRDALDLREDLALAGEAARQGIDSAALRAWSSAPPLAVPRYARAITLLLAALNVLAITGWLLDGFGPRPLIVVVALAGAWAMSLHARLEASLRAAQRPGRELALVAAVLRRIERERFRSPFLVELRRRLDTDGLAPSAQLRRLARLQEYLDSRLNQLFAPVALLLLWSTQFALAIEAWRWRVGPRIPAWLDALGELEAACALGAYAWEHPDDPFPELLEEGPVLDARALGHPLIPRASCVRNDVRLDAGQRLLLVSGSNMSGKSTLLRTAGLNLVLALAGAPVRAASVRVSPLSLGASIRLHDSLQQGASRFYAEITRLREIVELARERPPLLFLLDEILHGTNSSDRRVGAEAVVRALVARGAVGLVTTHDLALARIADELAPLARNVHFEDHVEEGRVAFDFRLKDGVVTRSNALALMRAVGLEV